MATLTQVKIVHFFLENIKAAEEEIADLVDDGWQITTSAGHGGTGTGATLPTFSGTPDQPGSFVVLVKKGKKGAVAGSKSYT